MICRLAREPAHCSARSSFTLVELLIVASIVVALIVLTAGTVIRFLTVQQQNNTRTALNKVQASLNKMLSAGKDQWLREPIPAGVQSFILNNLSGSDPNARQRVRVIYVKLKMRQMFPETFNEVFNTSPNGLALPAQLQPLPSYQNYLAQFGVNGSTTGQYQSSACLAMALQLGLGSGGFSAEDLGRGGSLGTVPVDPTSGPSVPMLLDGWGTPICFSRFPAGCAVLNPPSGTPQAGNVDPFDPLGTLSNGAWQNNMRNIYSALVLQDLAPAGQSFNLAPFLVSAGPDRQLGVDTFNKCDFAITNAAEANDNLYPSP